MLNNKTIAVVIPAYNEEKQISDVIESMPDFVDRIVVINDCSNDGTGEIVKSFWKTKLNEGIEIKNIISQTFNGRFERANRALQDQMKLEINLFIPSQVMNTNPDRDRIILINQLKNSGVGAAISRGYKWCKDYGIDCTAVMAGDGQMDPDELESICKPVVEENIDYVKGNRLIHRSALLIVPKIRYFGNSILSILTKIASGYWHVSDSQCGFTAISNKALNAIRLYQIYPRYGMPNDLLVKLNIAFCTLKEVGIKPVYDIGEKSKMKIGKVIPRISWLLFKSFFKRLWGKYLFRDFHPLFILYNLGFLLLILSIPYIIKIINTFFLHEQTGTLPVLAFFFLFISGIQFLLFAMWMDIQDNERLYKS
jgi:glycosyltransferase involved in cell wall biosynthesis